MKFILASSIVFALISSSIACFGGSGSQCCAPTQPSCGNPCGGGAAIGPAAYPAYSPQSYALPPPPPPPPATYVQPMPYPVAGGGNSYTAAGK